MFFARSFLYSPPSRSPTQRQGLVTARLGLLLVLEVVDEVLEERSLLVGGGGGLGLDLGVDLLVGSAAHGSPRAETGQAVHAEGDVLVGDLLAENSVRHALPGCGA